jgi:hypothetical protein
LAACWLTGPLTDRAHAASTNPAAARSSATFRVSFYGIQRYTSTTTSRENPGSGCFDVQQRGREEGTTIVRFQSRRPTLLTVTRSPGLPAFAYPPAADSTFQLATNASWTTGGITAYEISGCLDGARVWHDAPLPPHDCGTRTLSSVGASLTPETPAALLFHGGHDLAQLVDPLARCAYGEHQYGLYEARGAYSTTDLLDPTLGKHIVILRGHARQETPFSGRGGIGKHVVETRTTVYVTFARVR